MNSGFGWEEPFEDGRSGPEDQADDWSTTNDSDRVKTPRQVIGTQD